jgi:hypothetical protein
MRNQKLAGRFRMDDKVSLRADVVDDTSLLFLPVLTYDQPKTKIGNRPRRDRETALRASDGDMLSPAHFQFLGTAQLSLLRMNR